MVGQSLNSQCTSASNKHLEHWRPIMCLNKFHKLHKKRRLNYCNQVLYEILTLCNLDMTDESQDSFIDQVEYIASPPKSTCVVC